jgi:hypothetical protein
MAWTVDKLFDFVKFLTRKNQTASITPAEFNLAWNSEQRSLQSELLGKFQPRSNSKAGQNTGLIENQTILSSLAPFTTLVTKTVDVTGAASKPTDLAYLLAIRCGDRVVRMVNKGQIYAVINTSIDPPNITTGTFYATEYDTFFKVWPSQAASIDIDYIRDCPDIVYGYTEDANGVAQYDAGNSVQPLWKNAELQEITKRTLKQFGVSMSERAFVEFGQSNITTGS